MKELDKLTTRSRTGTCLPTSSACVKWEGPSIPCLTICKGESIEQVIVELSSIVCTTKDSIDISSLDFNCLVPNGQANPSTIKQLLQLLITKSCQTSTVDPGTGGGDGTLPVIDLPACLQFQDSSNNVITSLGLDEYAEHLAVSMCDILDDISNINQQIYTLNSTVNGLPTGGSGSGGGSATITITSKCNTLSSTSVGATIPIQTAFETLEENLCQDYLTPMTTPAQIAGFNNTASLCPTKDTLTPCGGKYGDISGWIQSPVTSFEFLRNMALAICKLDECAKYAPSGICVPLPPSNIQILNLTATGCNIKWTNPLSSSNPDLADPIEIRFYFYHPSNLTTPITLAAGPFSGGGTQTYMSFSPSDSNINNNLVNGAFVAGVEYVIRGYATYSDCGTSLAFAEKASKVKELNATALVHYSLGAPVTTPKICDGILVNVGYVETKRTVRLELRHPVTNAPVGNGTGQQIIAKFNLFFTNPCNTTQVQVNVGSTPAIYVDVPIVELQTLTVVIANNSAYGTADFIESEKITCTGVCKDAGRVLKCFVEVKLADGSALPSGLLLHSSLTAVPVCP
jgi:hypothetical protein